MTVLETSADETQRLSEPDREHRRVLLIIALSVAAFVALEVYNVYNVVSQHIQHIQ